MAYGIIYKATGPIGKVYIGQTIQTLKSRKSAHKYMSLKKDRRSAFQSVLFDEGFDAFTWEEIDQAETQEELDAKEKAWIAHYDSMNPEKGYNNTDGGIKTTYSLESRCKISEALKGNKNHIGKRHTAETRRKMSELMKGNKNNLGKHHSPETRKKMSESLKGRTVTAETRRKLSEAHKKNGYQVIAGKEKECV
jgi:group I intron endonuclease